MPDTKPSVLPPPPLASLRTYLVAMILIATVPIALFMSWQIWRDVAGQQARIETQLGTSATLLARGVERELDSTIDALTILSYKDAAQRGDPAGLQHSLQQFSQLRPSWRSAFLATPDGVLLFDTEPASAPPSEVAELARRVAAGGKPMISNLMARGAPRCRW